MHRFQSARCPIRDTPPTRATKWAYFSTTVDDSLPLLQKLLPLEQTRQLTVRRGDQAAALKQAAPAVQPAPDNKLDFL